MTNCTPPPPVSEDEDLANFSYVQIISNFKDNTCYGNFVAIPNYVKKNFTY